MQGGGKRTKTFEEGRGSVSRYRRKTKKMKGGGGEQCTLYIRYR